MVEAEMQETLHGPTGGGGKNNGATYFSLTHNALVLEGKKCKQQQGWIGRDANGERFWREGDMGGKGRGVGIPAIYPNTVTPAPHSGEKSMGLGLHYGKVRSN